MAIDREIDLKQNFELIDYLGAPVVWCLFFVFIFFFSVTILNWCCVTNTDDITVLEHWGHKRRLNMRLGPHRPSVVARHVRPSHKSQA